MTEEEWTHIKAIKVTQLGNSEVFNPTTVYLAKGNVGKCFELKFRPLEEIETVEKLRAEGRKKRRDAIRKSYEPAIQNAFEHACLECSYAELITDENFEKYPRIYRDTKDAYMNILRKGKGMKEFLESDMNIEFDKDDKPDYFYDDMVDYFTEDVQKTLSKHDPDLVKVAMYDLKNCITGALIEELREVTTEITKKTQRRTLGKMKIKEKELQDDIDKANKKLGLTKKEIKKDRKKRENVEMEREKKKKMGKKQEEEEDRAIEKAMGRMGVDDMFD